jgi:hypothetical protein
MEISTNINLGTVSADIDVDIDDVSEGLQPYISGEVENQIGDIDWDFVDDMIRDKMHDGRLDDIVSDAVANHDTEVDGAGIANSLLREYLTQSATGNSDETGCTLASTFEKAVRVANQRNTRSSGGAGVGWARDTDLDDLRERLAQLERIVRRVALVNLSHTRDIAAMTSGIADGLPIFQTGDDDVDTITDNTAAILG